MSREFDFIIYGASGFTGEFVVKTAKASLAQEGREVKWALAGRSQAKLDEVKKRCEVEVPCVIADVADQQALNEMAKRCKVVLNCVGPYRHFGEPVVRACAENGTDYVDLCGEPEFLEKCQLQFHKTAQDSGALIVGSCGFDSIPQDLGAWFVREQYKGGVCFSIEAFLSFKAGPKGAAFHYATYQCAVEGFGSAGELKKIRQQLSEGKPKLKTEGAKLKLQKGPFNDGRFPGQTLYAFPGADASVVKRSQEHFTEEDPAHTSFHHACYFMIPSTASWKMGMYGGMFSVLTGYQWGRNLLLKYPGFFTNGTFSHEGPTEEQLKETSFEWTFHAKGRDATLSRGEILSVEARVAGPEPGYVCTAILLLQAALALIKCRASLPKGGVYTPGYIFSKTDLIERLRRNGMQIEVTKRETKSIEIEDAGRRVIC